MRQRLMRDNVAQVAVLEVVPGINIESCRFWGCMFLYVFRRSKWLMAGTARKVTGPLICVANVHVFSNPKFPDVKLWQTNMLIKQVCACLQICLVRLGIF